MELRWLKEDDYQGASQKFIRFCKEDIFQQAELDPNFDFEIYTSSIRLILEKLDQLKEQQIRGVL